MTGDLSEQTLEDALALLRDNEELTIQPTYLVVNPDWYRTKLFRKIRHNIWRKRLAYLKRRGAR